jgi:hypothetical protein
MYTIDILDKNNTAFSKIINPQGLNFKLTLEGKDTAKFTLPLSHPRANAENLKKHNRIVLNRVNPKDRTDVRRVWVGYIEAVRIVDDNNLEVGCKGIFQLFDKRVVTRSFTNWQGGLAVFEILNDEVNPADETGIEQGETDVTNIFSHDFFQMQVSKAFEKIEEATFCEILTDTDFKLNCKQQIGEDKTESVIFRFIRNLQNANSIDNFTLLQEGKELFNKITCYGKNNIITAVRQDNASIAEFGLLEKVRYFTEIEDQNTLNNNAEALLALYKPVKEIPNIKPDKSKIDLFDYGVGDRVRVIIKHGILDFDQTHRILSITVTVGRNNEESIDIEIAQEGTKSVKSDEEQLAELAQRVEELES